MTVRHHFSTLEQEERLERQAALYRKCLLKIYRYRALTHPASGADCVR